MNPFAYAQAENIAGAVRLAATDVGARYLGGGTNLVDLMREGIETPSRLIDVTRLSTHIEEGPSGGLMIGAGARNSAVAEHRGVREHYPVLARAILTGASGQIRNMATVGGNILQRTRCTYFYDEAARCNKRAAGEGCDAIDGHNRIHAILGASPSCVATHPSDMCVALAALDAIVHVESAAGRRAIPFVEFHRLPEGEPDRDTQLASGELITAVELPGLLPAAKSTYRKVRDRASYAFALVSVAAVLELEPDGTVRDVRVALGGVAHKPWRATVAEAALRGQRPDAVNVRRAAEAELASAAPLKDNAFKVELAIRTITAVIDELAGDQA